MLSWFCVTPNRTLLKWKGLPGEQVALSIFGMVRINHREVAAREVSCESKSLLGFHHPWKW